MRLRVVGWKNLLCGTARRRCGARWLVGVCVGLWLLCYAGTASAQQNDLFFDALTPAAHGLPPGQVQAIVQDRYGFMWFGVQGGLAKYDGQTVTNYTHDPGNLRSLSDNNVTALYEDRQGTLWVGTNVGGLNRFDRTTGTFTQYQPDATKPGSINRGAIWSIYEDRAGTLWLSLSGGGLGRLDRASGSFTQVLPDPQHPRAPVNYVSNLYEDQRGNFWLCTKGGLVRYDRAAARFAVFVPGASITPFIVQAYEDRAGRLWAASDRGLLRFDRDAGRFTMLMHDERDPNSLSSNAVNALIEDDAGALWVGTGNGLNRFTPETNRFERYTNDATDPNSLRDNLVVALARDRVGALWVGSAGGVDRLQRGTERFARYRFRANDPQGLSNSNLRQVYEDRAGMIWVATRGGGLNQLDRRTGRFTHFRHDARNSASLSSDQVNAVCEDRMGGLWVGTQDGGLNLLDRRSGACTHFRADPNTPTTLSSDQVQAIYEDSAGTLWVATLSGLNRFERERRQFTRFLADPTNPRSLSSNRVINILEARDGTFWIATDGGGLNLLDRESGQFTSFKNRPEDAGSLSSNAVVAITEDAAGAIWVATLGGGINWLERATGRFTRYTEKDGLVSNNVWGLLASDDGTLWLHIDQGAMWFDPRTGKFHRYTMRDGLASDGASQNGCARLRSGELMFSGGGGLTIFDPQQLSAVASPLPPAVVLTAFKKFDQLVNLGRDLAEIRAVNLAQRENFFSFEFAVLDYKEPSRNQFAYRLEGFDRDWVYCGTRRYASYTNLDAGTYLFRVKGANSDGVWNEQGVAVTIKITPPFWRTWWFAALLVGLSGGVLALAYRRRIRQLQQAQAARETFAKHLIASQEQERKRIAAELHDGLGQNLLIIKNYALLGLDEESAAAKEENLAAISETTSQALDEVRQIAYNLRPYQIDRFGLTKALRSMFDRVAEVSEIDLQHELGDLDGLFAPEAEINLYRIVQESLNNLLKHARATEAEISITRAADHVRLRIADNGQGFAPDAVSAKQGFGLTGIAERARLLGGHYQLQTAPGQGTVIHITIPLPER